MNYIPQLLHYKKLLTEYNKKINLTAIKDEEIIERHFKDSLALLDFIQLEGKVTDIGTGAGLPGIPLAVVCPSAEFTLLDSLRKRTFFLEKVVKELGLPNVQILTARAEEFGHGTRRESYDFALARAVAPLDKLAEYALPLLARGGKFIAYKGKNIESELAESTKAIEVLGGKIQNVHFYEISGNIHCFAVIDKILKTPEEYPRKAHKMKKPIYQGD